ncbi:MAG TPA: oxaloacetate decarboxylase [Methylomirabilota bacterium]|jgi:carboxyvinyl-carboxyphosphonate phosphorylmutase|nr:oxaloacetate decarboxylase [Methylomirabilota bacterium]
MDDARPTTHLRRLLARPRLLLAPGAYDPLSARVVEEAGFEAVYVTGSGVSVGHLGLPDLGLATMTEMVDQIRRIAAAVRLPVIADADTGYGNALNVRRTVREYEAAGAAALHLEDQEFPKRCGHLEGKRVIPAETMVTRIRAAGEARRDPDFVIIARTDARAVLGLDEALRRAAAYREAGADVLFVEAPVGEAEVEAVARALAGVPLLLNLGGGGKTPMLPARRLEALGFRVAIYPGDLQKAAIRAMGDVARALAVEGTTAACAERMVSFEERFELVGLARYRELEARYRTS